MGKSKRGKDVERIRFISTMLARFNNRKNPMSQTPSNYKTIFTCERKGKKWSLNLNILSSITISITFPSWASLCNGNRKNCITATRNGKKKRERKWAKSFIQHKRCHANHITICLFTDHHLAKNLEVKNNKTIQIFSIGSLKQKGFARDQIKRRISKN